MFLYSCLVLHFLLVLQSVVVVVDGVNSPNNKNQQYGPSISSEANLRLPLLQPVKRAAPTLESLAARISKLEENQRKNQKEIDDLSKNVYQDDQTGGDGYYQSAKDDKYKTGKVEYNNNYQNANYDQYKNKKEVYNYPPQEYKPGQSGKEYYNQYPANDVNYKPGKEGYYNQYPTKDDKYKYPPEKYPPVMENKYPTQDDKYETEDYKYPSNEKDEQTYEEGEDYTPSKINEYYYKPAYEEYDANIYYWTNPYSRPRYNPSYNRPPAMNDYRRPMY